MRQEGEEAVVDELDNGVAHEAPAVGSGVQVLLLRVPGPEHTTQPSVLTRSRIYST